MSPKARRIRSILKGGGKITPAIVFWTDDEGAAFSEEIRLIAQHGRENLTNLTDGGDGVRNLSPDGRERIAASRRGKKASVETRLKQRLAKIGKPRSAETRAKIAAYQRGSKHPWARLPRSAEHRLKLSTFKGRKHTPETIAKMRAAKIGHPVSQETRDKISASKRAKTCTPY